MRPSCSRRGRHERPRAPLRPPLAPGASRSSPWTTATTTPSRPPSARSRWRTSTPRSTGSRRRPPDGEIVGVGVTGKPFIFAVGADLNGVELLKRHEDALAIGKGGHDVFKRLAKLAVPTFAYYNGAAMGGGVEIGLHCAYRTVSAALPAFSLPEVFLGLVPGWGGCTLLPNLIGADKAVSVIIENSLNQNKQLKGAQVYELGIADAIFEGADFLEQSLIWTASVLKGEIAVERPAIDCREAWDQAVAKGRFIADGKVHGAAPAAYRALDIIAAAKNGDLQQGYDAEDQALADLIMGGELRSGIYAFNLVQKRGKRPAGAPDKSLARPVTRVGVVGAGLMASQLALLFPAPPGGAGRPDRHRPGARRQGCGLRPRRDRQAARQGPDQPGQGEPAEGPGLRCPGQGRGLRGCGLHHRGRVRGDGRQAEGVRRGRGGAPAPRSSPPTPRPSPSRRWRRN